MHISAQASPVPGIRRSWRNTKSIPYRKYALGLNVSVRRNTRKNCTHRFRKKQRIRFKDAAYDAPHTIP